MSVSGCAVAEPDSVRLREAVNNIVAVATGVVEDNIILRVINGVIALARTYRHVGAFVVNVIVA